MQPEEHTFQRMPGLYRLWDLPLVIDRRDEYQVHYVELTEDGAPLFALYRRASKVLHSSVCGEKADD